MRFQLLFQQRLNIGIATREGRHIFKPIDNSKEKINHSKRISEKISCFYSRDYQIPDQPKIIQLNLKTDSPNPIIKIKIHEIWDEEVKETAEASIETENLPPITPGTI
jgi:hypothetical protein